MRILFSREMTTEQQAAFQQWASEQYEWGQRIHDAKARERAYEHEMRVALLRGNSELFAARSRGSEEITVVTGDQKGKAA
jgi:hypothetical protein